MAKTEESVESSSSAKKMATPAWIVSRLDPAVTYPVRMDIDPGDRGRAQALFQIELFSEVVAVVSLGKSKHLFEDRFQIVYFPLYLVQRNQRAVQIGLVEVFSHDLDRVTTAPRSHEVRQTALDASVAALQFPKANRLLFPFVTAAWVRERRWIQHMQPDRRYDANPAHAISSMDMRGGGGGRGSSGGARTSAAIVVPAQRAQVFHVSPNASLPLPLEPETRRAARAIRRMCTPSPSHSWLQTAMRNPYYQILSPSSRADEHVETGEDGEARSSNGASTMRDRERDSLFECIRDAFASEAQHTSVAKLRAHLAQAVVQSDVLASVGELLDAWASELERRLAELEPSIQALKQEYDRLRRDIRQRVDHGGDATAAAQDVHAFVTRAQHVQRRYDALLQEKKMVSTQWKFARHRKSGLSMRPKEAEAWIRASPTFTPTHEFLDVLGRCLNIQLVVLRSDAASHGILDQVVQAYPLLDPVIRAERRFTPDQYLLVESAGTSAGGGESTLFRLVAYKDHLLFTFAELPFDLKRAMCVAAQQVPGCVYTHIPAVQQFTRYLRREQAMPDQSVDRNEMYVSAAGLPNALAEGHWRAETAAASDWGAGGEEFGNGAYGDGGAAGELEAWFPDRARLLLDAEAPRASLPGLAQGEMVSPRQFVSLSRLWALGRASVGWRRMLHPHCTLHPFRLQGRQWASVTHYLIARAFQDLYPHFYEMLALDSGTAMSKKTDLALAAGSRTGQLEPGAASLRPPEVVRTAELIRFARQHQFHWELAAQRARLEQHEELRALLLCTGSANLYVFVAGREPVLDTALMQVRSELRA